MSKPAEMTWHKEPWARVERAWEAGRMPHALLLEGPAGLGKLAFARRVAALALTGELPSGNVDSAWAHPDLRETTLPEDKKQIVAEQIRELCSQLVMTSHSGGYKVALIHPADRMNAHAANSLLKTLEEPTPGTLLILVRSRVDTLPATIASRCQRIRFAAPGREESLAWLREQHSDRDFSRLLTMAGGAPLMAVDLADAGLDELDRAFRQDLAGILRGEESPVAVASRWQKGELDQTIGWLNAFVTELIRAGAVAGDNVAPDLQIFHENIRLDSLFGYLDEVQAAVARSGSALAPQLVLEGLLVPWRKRLN